jgi:hypothetical protein
MIAAKIRINSDPAIGRRGFTRDAAPSQDPVVRFEYWKLA